MKTINEGNNSFQKLAVSLARALVVAGFLLSALAGRGQMPPLTSPLLDYWPFSDTNFLTGFGYSPLAFTNIESVTNWASAADSLNENALLLDSTNSAYLQYNVVENDGTTNLICPAGSVHFWFSPDWSSVSQGGTGPGDWGRFIDVGAWTTNATYGWWSLYLSADGNNIYFSGQTNNGSGADYLVCPISWTNNSWHLIGLTYTASNSLLYVDGQLATNGTGVSYWPGNDVLTNGFFIGSDYTGLQQARGQFVDLETWSSQLSASYISNYYATYWPELPGNGGYDSDPPGGGGGGDPPADPPPGARLTAPVLTNGNVKVFLFNQDPTVPYDIYATTNLASPINWTLVSHGAIGVTNYVFANSFGPTAFFIGGSGADTVGQGLSDGFIALVLHLNPFASSPDGMTVGWKYLHGLNPALTYTNYVPPATPLTITKPANHANIQ